MIIKRVVAAKGTLDHTLEAYGSIFKSCNEKREVG